MTQRALTERERLDCLRLARSEQIGPANYRRLIRRYGSAGEALARLPELAKRGGRTRPLVAAPVKEIEAELADAAKLGAQHLFLNEADYPAALAAIEDAPPCIILLGNDARLAQPCVALVGARNASGNGQKLARDLAQGLAAAGWCVVSGLARGIDGAAHQGALAAGLDKAGTIAVVAGGVDNIYPQENAALRERILEAGLVVSEMPPGFKPRDIHFPRRNRIISGLSKGVVVVEAALRSGSLITARMAGEQGREVMAVPGSPLDPRCRGANRLIREGAALIEDADQILEILTSLRHQSIEVDKPLSEIDQPIDFTVERDVDRTRRDVLDRLGPSPIAVDELLRQCQSSPPVIGQVLLELDLAGRLERHPGNRVSLLAAP
ncbi:DNA-processing protein DprA [Dongia deserti]|uniref:DNA-processing protein DprA n=1 Tax=Dongia deserti TaxID=2268030 RepID=UPI000E655847|nr:DNA-processing protein DprA [Dongia deserti]